MVPPAIDFASAQLIAEDLTVQNELKAAWISLIPSFPESNAKVLPSIQHALQHVKEVSSTCTGKIDILVTGSLHLVGGVIEVAGLTESALSL